MVESIWKQHPFSTTSWLYLWKPTAVFIAQVIDDVTYNFPLNEISTSSADIISGNIFNIEPGMTLMVGTAPGKDDLGRTRVRARSYNGISIPIGRSSRGNKFGEINPSNGAYITVLEHYDVWSKIPHIDEDTGIIYKDETLYNRAIAKPPIAHAGPHIAAPVDPDTGLLTLDFDASESTIVDPNAGSVDYFWDFGPGAEPEIISGEVVEGVTFPAGPPRYISLTVVHNSVQHTTRRIIYPIPVDPTHPDAPYQFKHDDYKRVLEPEGQVFSCRVMSDLGEHPAGCILLFMQQEYFGDTAGPLSGDSLLKFVGYVTSYNSSIEGTADGTRIETRIEAEDFLRRMQSLPGFPTVVERRNYNQATTWNHMPDADIDQYLHHLIHWNSTLAEVTGVKLSGLGQNYPVTTLGSSGASLYTQIDKIARAITHRFTSNAYGMVQIVEDPFRRSILDRTEDVIVDIDASDWTSIRYVRNYYPKVHWINGSAIVASPNSVPVVFSRAPGHTPGQGVSAQSVSQLLVLNQQHLNIIIGQDYARINAEYNVFDLELAHRGDIGIDPGEMKWVRVTIPENIAAYDNTSFIDARFLPLSVTFTVDGVTNTQRCSIKIERETDGPPGVTYIPPKYQLPQFPEFDFELPDIDIPQLPGGEVGPPPIDDGAGVYVIVTSSGVLYATEEISAMSPGWESLDLKYYGFDDTAVHAKANPFSDSYMDLGSEVDTFIVGLNALWRVRDTLGPNLQVQRVYDFPSVLNQRQIEFSRGVKNWSIIISWDDVDSLPVMATWSRDLVNWETNNVTSAAPSGDIADEAFYPGLWMSIFEPGIAMTSAFFTSGAGDSSEGAGYITRDYGRTWNVLTNPDLNPGDFLAETIEIPYNLSLLKNTVFFTRSTYVNPNKYDSRLYRAIGTQVKDISPTPSAIARGPIHSPRAFDISEANTQRIFLLAADTDGSGGTGLYYSSNALSSIPTWTLIEAPTSHWQVFAAGSDEDVCFLISTDGKVGFVKIGATTGIADKTGNMTHGEKIVGIISGSGINTDGTGGWNPPDQLPGPSLPAVSETAIVLDDSGNVGYTESFRAFSPTYTQVSLSVTGTITDISWDESCEYITNGDGTGQVDIYAVTIDGSGVIRIYLIEDLKGTPVISELDDNITLGDPSTAIEPRIENDTANPDWILVSFGDNFGHGYRYTDDGGFSWLGTYTTFESEIDMTGRELAMHVINGNLFGTTKFNESNTDRTFFAIQRFIANTERKEYYSDFPFIAVRAISTAAFAARPARLEQEAGLLFDFDDNPNYVIAEGTLEATGISGNAVRSVDNTNQLDINMYLARPQRLRRLTFSWRVSVESAGTSNSLDHVDFAIQTYNESNSLIHNDSVERLFTDYPVGSWHVVSVDLDPTDIPLRIRITGLMSIFGSTDYWLDIDNVYVEYDQSDPIDSIFSAQLLRIDPIINPGLGNADWYDVTPGGINGYVPTKTWGLATSQNGNPNLVAIVGRNASGAVALARSADQGLTWLTSLLNGDYDQLVFSEQTYVIWGDQDIRASSNNGGTFFSKRGNWRTDIQPGAGFKKVLVKLYG